MPPLPARPTMACYAIAIDDLAAIPFPALSLWSRPHPRSLVVATITLYVCIGESASPPRNCMNATATPSSGTRSDTLPPRKAGPLRLLFRIIRWTTYAAAIITLLMVFHAAPPPAIATSPQAAASVERKVEAVEQAVASGQSATLHLDQTELNSYLASHLDISPAAPTT